MQGSLQPCIVVQETAGCRQSVDLPLLPGPAGPQLVKMTNYTSGRDGRNGKYQSHNMDLNSDQVKNVHDVFGIDFSSFLVVNTLRSSTVSFEYFIL